MYIGTDRVNCDDMGTKNHIIQDPYICNGFSGVIGVAQHFACNQPSTIPVNTSDSVDHLSVGGRMYGIVFIGSIHWMAAPLTIEAVDSVIIGTMML